MKPYSYYAYSAFRAYFLGSDQTEPTPAVKASHSACEAALSGLDEESTMLLRTVYSAPEGLADAIRKTTTDLRVRQNDIWTLVAKAERLFAQYRGLI